VRTLEHRATDSSECEAMLGGFGECVCSRALKRRVRFVRTERRVSSEGVGQADELTQTSSRRCDQLARPIVRGGTSSDLGRGEANGGKTARSERLACTRAARAAPRHSTAANGSALSQSHAHVSVETQTPSTGGLGARASRETFGRVQGALLRLVRWAECVLCYESSLSTTRIDETHRGERAVDMRAVLVAVGGRGGGSC